MAKKVALGAATVSQESDKSILVDLRDADVAALIAPLTALLAKFPAAAGDLATQTTLAAVLAKLAATPALAGEAASAATAVRAVLLGTGLPIPLAFADPGDSDYTDLDTGNVIDRDCTRLRVLVADSGVVISLDGGVTDSISVPADYAEDMAVAIPAGSDIRVKRYAAGTALSGLIVEVR